MRLVVADCSIDYSGRLDTHLPRAVLPDVPAAVVECAQAAAPSVETDRLAADIALFGGEFVTVLNLVLPPDCLPQTGGLPSRHTGR